jgi:hypothetical protein
VTLRRVVVAVVIRVQLIESTHGHDVLALVCRLLACCFEAQQRVGGHGHHVTAARHTGTYQPSNLTTQRDIDTTGGERTRRQKNSEERGGPERGRAGQGRTHDSSHYSRNKENITCLSLFTPGDADRVRGRSDDNRERCARCDGADATWTVNEADGDGVQKCTIASRRSALYSESTSWRSETVAPTGRSGSGGGFGADRLKWPYRSP